MMSILKKLFAAPFNLLHHLLEQILHLIIFFMLVFLILHRLGLIRRFIQRFAENEVSKILNGARVTVASIEIDLLVGHAHVKDLVIHTSERDKWAWDSPLIARVGTLMVDFNLLSCIDHISDLTGYPCKELYSITVEDVQVFVEKRRNVFNFHLLDPSLDLPDPSTFVKNERDTSALRNIDGRPQSPQKQNDGDFSSAPTYNTTNDHTTILNDKQLPSSASSLDGAAEIKANEIVTSMLGAVSSLGRAANEGGKEGLEKAFRNHKDGFVSRLKQFQASVVESNFGTNTTTTATPDGQLTTTTPTTKNSIAAYNRSTSFQRQNSKTPMEMIAMEGMKVMKQVGKAVEKNVSEIQQQMDAFKKPPPKKKDWVEPETDDIFRCGRIIGRDIRIFTKDIILGTSRPEHAGEAKTRSDDQRSGYSIIPGSTPYPKQKLSDDGNNDSKTRPDNTKSPLSSKQRRPPNATGWSRPILLKTIFLSSSELSPPVSAKDDKGLPSIGLPIKQIIDVVLAKLVAEMAKSNSGRLLQTAVGEVFAWMELKGGGMSGGGSGTGGGTVNRRASGLKIAV